jgi:phosphoglycerate kinase
MKISEIKNSKVFVRVNFDVPSISDTARIFDSVKTVQMLLSNSNQVILISHWGRPEGSRVTDMSLEKLLPAVQTFYSESVEFINQYDYFDKNISLRDLLNISNSKLFLFENTRFSPNESSKNLFERDELAQKYAGIVDYFVDEAFSLSHRQEVTNYEIKKLLPYSYGLSFENELRNLEKIKSDPKQPFVVIMAGAKLETKLPLIEKMCEKVDKILIGGQLCFTFLVAAESKIELYNSAIDLTFLEKAKELISKYKDKIVLPVDFKYSELDGKKMALDIGEASILRFKSEIENAETIFWNGPLGYYFDKDFAEGTLQIAGFIANLKKPFKVLGGGDSIAVLPKEVLQQFDFVSMGGGATLEYLSN